MFYAAADRIPKIWSHIDALRVHFENISAADNMIAFDRNFSFADDGRFNDATSKNARTDQERSIFWRLHVLTWAASQVLDLEGDFVECGVFHGYSSAVICDYLDFGKLNRKYYLYDTFEGLPVETSTDAERESWNSHYQSAENLQAYANVCSRFSKYYNVEVVKGIVPLSFETTCPKKIAFMHLDMNAARAEILALEALYERMTHKGIIVLDDYGWVANRPQMVAEREFFAKRGKSVLELPTGQGLVIV